MITLVTGRPGAGKTLWTVAQLDRLRRETDRPIFSDIDGLNLEGVECLPGDDPISAARGWVDLPDRSIICLDECQRAFPPRQPLQAVPRYIAEFETHRHRGLDFFLITQHPKLIENRVRHLVGEHVHLYRPLGFKRSRVFRWQGVNEDPDPKQTAETAESVEFVFPRRLFAAYSSAVDHTVRGRIPRKLLALIAAASVLLLGGGAYAVSSWGERIAPPDEQIETPRAAEAKCYARIGERLLCGG